MRILLTGATGFVGSHLLRGLLKDGHEICIGKRSSSDLWRIRDILKDCRAYDLDKTDINRICSDWPAECIVHCATHYVRDNREYYKNINSNLLFPLELLSTGKDYGVRYFINTFSLKNSLRRREIRIREFILTVMFCQSLSSANGDECLQQSTGYILSI